MASLKWAKLSERGCLKTETDNKIKIKICLQEIIIVINVTYMSTINVNCENVCSIIGTIILKSIHNKEKDNANLLDQDSMPSRQFVSKVSVHS